jgi:hypothetical protein
MTKKPGKPESDEPDVIIEEGKKDDEKRGVEVDLNEPEHEEADELKVDPEEFKKLHRRNEYLNRQLENTMKQVESMTKQMAQFQSQQTPSQKEEEPQEEDEKGDELDEVAKKDWKQAVRILAKQEAEMMRDEEDKARAEEQRKLTVAQELEESKGRVLTRYPNIEDTTTEEAQAYIQVLNENPALLRNPRGPELAMYKMEESMRAKGVVPASIKEEVKEEAGAEINRRLRAHAGKGPQGRPAGEENKIRLTPEEQAHCDKFGIPYVEYAKMYKLGTDERRQGISV